MLLYVPYDEFIERENNLTIFKEVMFKIAEMNEKLQGLSVNIIKHEYLPRKPENYKGKAKWYKAFLGNGLPRQYMIVQASLQNKEIYIIEIEKSNEDDNISNLVLSKNGLPLHSSLLYNIVRDYVEFGGRWIMDGDIKKSFIYHIGGIENRAKRIYKKIISI